MHRALAGGEEHAYALPLAAGDTVDVEAEQRGVDLTLRLVDPAGREVMTVDGPTWRHGHERLLAVAAAVGEHRLVVAGLAGEPGGEYVLRRRGAGAASPAVRRRAEAAAALTAGAPESRLLALRATSPARSDPVLAAELDERLAALAAGRRDWPAAETRYAAAAAAWRRLGRAWRAALADTELGFARRQRNHLDGAFAAYERALPVRRAHGDVAGEAAVLQNLGDLHYLRGELDPARRQYRRSRARWRRAGDALHEAEILFNLGVLHQALDELDEARRHFAAAAGRFARLGSGEQEAAALTRLGTLHAAAGRRSEATTAYLRALALRRREGDRAGEAVTLTDLARLDRQLGRAETARARYRRALALLEEEGERALAAHVLHHLAGLDEEEGEAATARTRHRQALAVFEELGMPLHGVTARLGVARASAAAGDAEPALAELATALAAAERLRAAPGDPLLRASYFATVQRGFDLQVRLLAERGDERNAFDAAERARGRALLDEIAGATPGAERPLRRADRLAAPGGTLPNGSGTPSGSAAAGAGSAAAAPAGALPAAAHAPGPAGVSPAVVPAVLTLPEVQRRLLGPGTILLVYHLDEPASRLWIVDDGGLRGHPLAGRRRLEELARRLHRLLPASHRRESGAAVERALCEAGHELLGPAAEALSGRPAAPRRLWIVPDGALAYVPFAALPLPGPEGCAGAAPLLAGAEISVVPSASVAAALVERRARRPAPGLLAVVAVPESLAGLPPLPHTRSEAARVCAALPPGRRGRSAVGAPAAARMVASGELGRHRIVHLAAHAVVDPRVPQRSGILLGGGSDPWLRAASIRRLALSADLVVLSACRTALGRELQGEGLLGLAHAFFDAGAGGLVVSLWDVGDRSAAVLMDRFYRSLLGRGMPPAAALRQTQLELSEHPAWNAPAHWAGYAVQGDGWTAPLADAPRPEENR